MAFVRVKARGGRQYAYLVASSRESGRPRQRVVAYLGPVSGVTPERVPGRWRRAPAVVRWLEENVAPAQAAREARLEALRAEAWAAALSEDRARILREAQAAQEGLGPWEYIEGVLVPLQREVGDAWHRGETTTAQEHAITRAMGQVVEDLRGRTRAPARRRGPGRQVRVLLANPEGEAHGLALEVLEWRLSRDGHRTFVSSGGTPARDLVLRAREVDADLVLLSVTMPEVVPAAVETARALRDARRRMLVGMGGQAWRQARIPRLGARVRVVTSEAAQAVDALVRDAHALRAGR